CHDDGISGRASQRVLGLAGLDVIALESLAQVMGFLTKLDARISNCRKSSQIRTVRHVRQDVREKLLVAYPSHFAAPLTFGSNPTSCRFGFSSLSALPRAPTAAMNACR